MVQKNKQDHFLLLSIILVLVLICSILISLSSGSIKIEIFNIIKIILFKLNASSGAGILPEEDLVVWSIRLPRILLGVIVGAILACSGALMQGVFRNSLADPGLLGISSGAALFVSMGIVLGLGTFGGFSLPVLAFVGSFISMMLIYFIATKKSQTNTSTMLLAGIAINAICGAGTSIFTYLSSNEELRTITFWQLGSLGSANWNYVFNIAPFFLLLILFAPMLSKALDAMMLGESNAKYLGIQIERVKFIAILLISLSVGASVAICGMISFVGLVVPHLIRLMIGPKNKGLMICSMILGSILIVLSDLIARVIVLPLELPIGVVTSLLGAPFFLYLIIKNKRFL